MPPIHLVLEGDQETGPRLPVLIKESNRAAAKTVQELLAPGVGRGVERDRPSASIQGRGKMSAEGERGKRRSISGGAIRGKELSCGGGKHLIIVPIPAVLSGVFKGVRLS